MPATSLAGPRAPEPEALVVHLPGLRASLRHALAPIIEGVAGPVVFFYVALVWSGLTGALYAALGWSFLVLARRLARGDKVPAILWMGAAMLVVRTVISLLTGSMILYFAQPTATTALLGFAFAASALVRRPIIERLATDFCPLDEALLERPGVRRFFRRLSYLWAATLLLNAGLVLGLLLSSSLQHFVVERTAIDWGLSVGAIALSTVSFLRAMRNEGVTVRLHRHRPQAALTAP